MQFWNVPIRAELKKVAKIRCIELGLSQAEYLDRLISADVGKTKSGSVVSLAEIISQSNRRSS